MRIKTIKTDKVISNGESLSTILDKYLTTFKEHSILAITSKIVSICEGRVIKIGDADKKQLISQEAELLLPEESKYNITLTIKNNLLIPTAGIDESNGNGFYVLWPSDPQNTANKVRDYLRNRFSLKQVGVIITDSKTTPLRWGTTGVAIAHTGFSALNNYIGKPDIFGRALKVTKANIMDALAVTAVLIMGEGDEQTPLAVIKNIPLVQFQDRNPTEEELDELKISLDDDLYAPLLKAVKWKKGGNFLKPKSFVLVDPEGVEPSTFSMPY